MWNWLINPEKPYTWGFIARVVIKATLLFILLNLLFVLLQPIDALSRYTLYNNVFAGRERLPYGGDDFSQSNAVTMDNIPAMIASHQIARQKADDEFRVVIFGNSGIWGFWLPSSQTLGPQMTRMNTKLADGRRVVVYNLAYPYPYIIRDLLFMDEAMQYKPDMIIWVVSAASFWEDPNSPIILNNLDKVRHLVENYGLTVHFNTESPVATDFYSQTIIGKRATLLTLLQNQLTGILWNGLGIDHNIPSSIPKTPNDLPDDDKWSSFSPSQYTAENLLSFHFVDVGYNLAGDIPLIMINQPMFIATGENSDLRYNLDYPRWLFDDYRALFAKSVAQNAWLYCDLWDALPNEYYTDTPFHMNASGIAELGRILLEMITHYMELGSLGRDCE